MACSKNISSISFAEIIHGRDATVRVTHDHLIYAVDLVMVMTGKGRDDAGKTLRRLPEEIFSSDKMSERNTGGTGNSKTRLLSLEHAIELIMVLPGRTAKETRVQFADILRRYMAGDNSLITEINANAESSSPIAQMARESLGIDESTLVGFKRRREELELLKLEEEINTMRANNHKLEEETKGMAQARIIAVKTELEELNGPTKSNLDDRTRLMIQDALQNSILNTHSTPQTGPAQAMLTNGPNAPISISSVAAQLGYKPTTDDSKRIGVDLRKRYYRRHTRAPPKHDQLCDGRITSVNSYTEQDRPLVVEALHAYFRPQEDE